MEFIKKIQHKLHDRMIKKQVAKSNPSRSSVSFDNARMIGILFDATELSDRKAILNYRKKLQGRDKKVQLLGYLDEKVNQPNFTFDHFCKQDLNWIGKNKSTYVDEFIRKKFDLLFCLNDNLPLVDIAARSSALLRVGPAIEDNEPFELMIEKGNLSQEKFIEQIEFFIMKINHKENV